MPVTVGHSARREDKDSLLGSFGCRSGGGGRIGSRGFSLAFGLGEGFVDGGHNLGFVGQVQLIMLSR